MTGAAASRPRPYGFAIGSRAADEWKALTNGRRARLGGRLWSLAVRRPPSGLVTARSRMDLAALWFSEGGRGRG
jgi:hypothetical protein